MHQPITRRQMLASTGTALTATNFVRPLFGSNVPLAKVASTDVISKQPHLYCGWPTLTRRRNGQLWLVWSGGREAHVCPAPAHVRINAYVFVAELIEKDPGVIGIGIDIGLIGQQRMRRAMNLAPFGAEVDVAVAPYARIAGPFVARKGDETAFVEKLGR